MSTAAPLASPLATSSLKTYPLGTGVSLIRGYLYLNGYPVYLNGRPVYLGG